MGARGSRLVGVRHVMPRGCMPKPLLPNVRLRQLAVART